MTTRFKPVPASPNAVSSRAPQSDAQHFVEPISVSTAIDDPMGALVRLLDSTDRVRIEAHDGGYLHAIFTTKIMRFKDDVEFELEGRTLHVRSASRVGYSDLGANRKRVEWLRAQLSQR